MFTKNQVNKLTNLQVDLPCRKHTCRLTNRRHPSNQRLRPRALAVTIEKQVGLRAYAT